MFIAGISALVLLMYIGGIIFVVVALIYFIVKRIEAKKQEDFEKRDN